MAVGRRLTAGQALVKDWSNSGQTGQKVRPNERPKGGGAGGGGLCPEGLAGARPGHTDARARAATAGEVLLAVVELVEAASAPQGQR